MLEKPPEIKDVLGLVKDISPSWYELGAELHVPHNDREFLRRDGRMTDRDRLEYVITNWIENETEDVKWKVILKALQKLRRRDLIKRVIEYLEEPQIHRKYISMVDYSPGKYNK